MSGDESSKAMSVALVDEGLVDDTAAASDMTARTISTDQLEIPGTSLAQNLDLQDKENLTILGGQLKFHVDTALI